MAQASPARSLGHVALLELAALEKRDFEVALQQILQADAVVLDVDRVAYWTLGEGGNRLSAELGYVKSLGAFERGISLTAQQYPAYFRALREEQVVVADDACCDKRTRELSESYLAPLGITSMLDVPVWARGRLVGVLCHEHTGDPRRWSAEECDLGIAIAQVVATTHEVRERIRAEESARRAHFVADASEALMKELDVERVPHLLAALVVEEMADWCLLEEAGHEGGVRTVATAHREPRRGPLLEELVERRAREPRGSLVDVRSLATERALLFRCSTEVVVLFGAQEPECAHLVRSLGARSAMRVPLAARGRVLATLTLVSGTRLFRPEDLALIEDLALRAAVHLDNLRLYREAREAIQARDEFIAVASHELNTPLTSLGLSVDSLRKGLGANAPEQLRCAAELVQRQQRRLTGLVREMLDVTCLRSRRLTLKRERVDFSEVLRELCATSEPELARVGIKLRCDIEPGIEGIWDRARLERVVENLLGNAAKFAASKPVEVRLSRRDDAVVELSVTDHGIGIPHDRLPYIFDRFERAVSAKQYAGLGLGLYISHGIVEAHGGHIRVESEEGKGTTFTVELPVSAGELPS